MSNSPEEVSADLAKLVRGDVFADILHRAAYSTDASIYQIIPCVVVAPQDAKDVVAAVRYAAGKNIPVAARGAGSGLAGESLCSGIVFDMTRYMKRIISIENAGKMVTCEPGIVLDDLNNRLAEYGTKIGPDPSSSNRATIGGCVANNATGAHSLQYGYIADYVECIEAVLADGSIAEFKNNLDPASAENPCVAEIAKECASVLSGSEEVIKKAMPATKRNRSGYNIAGACQNGKINLARLLAGSEGTLAVFTKITLKTVPVPPAKALLQLEFDSLEKMAQAVPAIVDSGAAACELMDKGLIDMAIDALPQYRDVLPAGAAAVLFIEQVGQSDEEVRRKVQKTDSAVGRLAANRKIVFDPQMQKRIWKSRKDAGPLLERMKIGSKHPMEFMEDVSVDNKHLGEYIAGLKEIGKKYDFKMFFFGHAGDGELHIRPYLDLRTPADVEKMQAIAEDVYTLAWSMGGSISGEHADGLVRAAFVRTQYGDEVYALLCKIKNVFDPKGLMNPGKILNPDPDIMIKNLRTEHSFVPERLKTNLLFEEDELAYELDQCYGCGLCLSCGADTQMCPVFRALGDELAASRAKANLVRFWMTGQLGDSDFDSPEFRKFLDLCVNCKICSLQCPAGVDISKIVSAARAEYVKRKGLRRAELLLSRNRYLGILGSTFAPVSNLVMKLPAFKWFLEKAAGLDRRRAMPQFERRPFLKAGRDYLDACPPIEKPADKVAYFVDTYANYNDHELGFAVLDVLRHNDIEVILPPQRPAPLPAIVYGDVKQARKDLSYSVKHLADTVRQGYKIVCSEPSAALCLRQELRHFIAGEDAKLVSANTFELMEYLLDLFKKGRLKPPAKQITQNYLYHCPCHLLALGDCGSSVELLRKLCKVNVVELNAGCCGLAGTFGMQKKNYELSEKISEKLKAAIEASPSRLILTECGACGMQIEHISKAIAIHPIKVMADCYSG